MITKGSIRSVPIGDSNIYKVWLPFFDDPLENASETILDATLSEAAGINRGYEVGDIVYCAFEDNNSSRPVIIGKLSTTNNVGGNISSESLTVENEVSLPHNTTIGDVDLGGLVDNIINNTTIRESIESGKFGRTPVETLGVEIGFGDPTNGGGYIDFHYDDTLMENDFSHRMRASSEGVFYEGKFFDHTYLLGMGRYNRATLSSSESSFNIVCESGHHVIVVGNVVGSGTFNIWIVYNNSGDIASEQIIGNDFTLNFTHQDAISFPGYSDAIGFSESLNISYSGTDSVAVTAIVL